MASQFDTAKVVLQPSQQEAPAQTNVFEQGAQVAGQLGGCAMQDAGQQSNRMSQLYSAAINTASSGFDRVLSEYNRYAEQKAKEEAPAAIKFDGDNNIVPPSSFYPPGISSRAYGETYAQAHKSVYMSSAEQELINHSNVLKEKFPANTAAYKAGMAEKVAAMTTNLDPTVAPWINLRGKQIESQGITQLAVQNQSMDNKVMKESADRDLVGIANDAARQATGHPIAQGGGGSPTGYDNNIGNQKISADKYHGGKGLPYRAPSGAQFETFESAEHGVAASYSLIKKKVAAAGGTLSFTDLVNSWATPNENSLASRTNMATAMAKGAGALPGAAVPIDDPVKMAGVLKEMNKFEKGKQTVSDEAFTNGVKLANGEKVPLTNAAYNVITADPRAAGLAADMVANGHIMAERIRQMEIKAEAAGDTPKMIERNRAELIFKTQMIVIGEQIRNSAGALYSNGDVNSGAIADAQDRIEQIATSGKFPGREQQVRDHLNKSLNEAATQASRRANQTLVDDKRSAAPIVRQMTADRLEAEAAGRAGDTVRAGSITKYLDEQAQGFLNNPRLSDSVAMTLASAAMQNGSVSRAAMQEGFQSRIQSMGAIIGDPLASSDQKAAAFANAQELRNNPEVHSQMTPGQRGAVQGMMDDYVTKNFALQVGAWDNEILKGGTSPQRVDEVRAYQIKNNMIPPEQQQRAALIDAEAKKLWHEGQTRNTLASQQATKHAAGEAWTAEEQAASEYAMQYKPASGGLQPNLADPRDLLQAQELYQKHGFLPKPVKAALDNMQYSPEQSKIDPYLAMVNTIKQVERKKMEQLIGHTQVDERAEEQLEAKVADIVGKHHPFLATAKLAGADAAFKNNTFNATGAGRNLGKTADQFQSDLRAELPRLGGTLAELANKTLVATAEETITLSAEEMAALSPEARAARQLREAQAEPGFFGGIAGMFGYGPGSKVERFEFDGGFGRALMQNATLNAAMNGEAIKTGLVGKPGTVESHVLATELYGALRRGEVSITRSADGKVATLGWKTLGDKVAPVVGIEMNESRQRHFAAALVDAHQFRVGGGVTLSESTNADNIAVRSYRSDEGELRINISERDRTGIWTTKLNIAHNDPMISVMSLSTIKAATQAVVANAADPKIYGGAVATALSGSGAPAMLAHAMTGHTVDIKFVTPVAVNFGVLLGSKIQQMQIALQSPEIRGLILGDRKLMNEDQLTALKNVQVRFRTEMESLSAELKKDPNGPGLKEAIAHMRQNFAPHVDDSAFIQMLKDSAFYKPIDLPIPKTGQSRIGTEKP